MIIVPRTCFIVFLLHWNINESSLQDAEVSPETPLQRSLHLSENLNTAFESAIQNTDGAETNTDSTEETDLNSLFVKYGTDDGNTCLLDNIKQEILWWTFPNGTLKTTNAKYGKHTNKRNIIKLN